MIRRATPDDIEAIEAADRVCFPFDKPYIFAWERNVSWVAQEEELVGYLSAHPLNGRGRWFFSRVGVMPSHRGRGLQRKLMATMEKHGRANGWGEIVTYTAGFNGWSTRNILAAGYRTYEPRKSYVGFEVVHLRKRL
jgi:ribosomal protein S18 acetylase RimI-like enzyme